jgi:uncharacterized protein YbjT (DUF2867 family)
MTPGGKNETAQGKAMIDEAVKAGIPHFVFSSVDRGIANDGNTPSNVEHWDTKHAIEQHLREASKKSEGKFTYTIIRPVAFFENFVPGFGAKVMANVWRDHLNGRPLKLVATADIGAFAAGALLNTESESFKNAEMNLAGDELTFTQANAVFKGKTGKELPTTNRWIVSAVLAMVKPLKEMVPFLRETGYGASVGAASGEIHVTDWPSWIDSSAYVASK